MDLIITILSVVTKDLSISPRFTPYNFLSRCKLNFTYSRSHAFRYERKSTNPTLVGIELKNRTHDFRTNRCAGYLLDHSGDHYNSNTNKTIINTVNTIILY